jgi:hypothetical protein
MKRYRQGYTGFDYHVTGGHEAEAKEAERDREREKPPNRIGKWLLKRLGYSGKTDAELYGESPDHPHHSG